MRLFLGFLAAGFLVANDAYPPAQFRDPNRAAKLEAAMPRVDEIFRRFVAEKKISGMVWGVVIDNKLAHVGTTGLRDRVAKAAVEPDTVFRIASMTKSFTTLAILKLRDDGKLSLEDPVSRWIPEFARMELPTRDTPPILVRQLLSHSAGFPEDNPWADQQLNITDAQLTAWLKAGIPFATAPGTRYEYSNYMWGLLGRIVTKASGVTYQRYVEREILAKLGMKSSTFDVNRTSAAQRAVGYRLKPDGTYGEEPPLPDGVFASAGALLTTASDMGKYMAFHLSAWPPRDEAETGPVRRASVREMAHLWTPSNLTMRRVDGQMQATQTGYGYGLRITTDCRFEHIVGHGGGLPGFGSYMMWLPEYGVGMFAMANLTYAGPSEPISLAFDLLKTTGAMTKRDVAPSKPLVETRAHIVNLWKHWDDAEAKQVTSMNFFLDFPSSQRQDEIQKLKDEVGECTEFGPMLPENWLRGQFNIKCARGTVGVFFTMAPTMPPAMQHLEFRKLPSEDFRMGAPTGPPSGVVCSE
jgi:CubicO group peptidase (beta-lactamase class C family)